MTMQVITKGADWTLSRETAEGAPEGIYGAQCLTCAERSGLMDNDPRPIRAWTIEHTRQKPRHRQFRFTTEQFCRVDPTPAAPPVPGPVGTVPPVAPARPTADAHSAEPRAHARRRTRKARRVLAYLGRFAGPIFLVVMASTCGLVVGVLLATA